MWRFDILSKETAEFTVAASVNKAPFFQDYVTEREMYLNFEVQDKRERTRVSSLPVIQWT